jgi:hypothetical protein
MRVLTRSAPNLRECHFCHCPEVNRAISTPLLSGGSATFAVKTTLRERAFSKALAR